MRRERLRPLWVLIQMLVFVAVLPVAAGAQTPVLPEAQKLVPSNPEHECCDQVVLDEHTGVASAWTGTDAIAYVFDRGADGVWRESDQLSTGHGRGPIALDDDILLIGAPEDLSVHVFRRQFKKSWRLEAILRPEDVCDWDPAWSAFGSKVAIDGNNVMVGLGVQCESGADAGDSRFWSFRRGNDGVWMGLPHVDVQTRGEHSRDFDLDGRTAVFGTIVPMAPWSFVSGVLVYQALPDETWTMEAFLENEWAADGTLTWFGRDVSLDRGTLVGADPLDVIGLAFVRSTTGTWTYQDGLEVSGRAGTRYPGAVAIDGDLALLGDPVCEYPLLCSEYPGPGAYLFKRSASEWSEQVLLKASDTLPDDNLGLSVSISRGTALVGSQQGAYVFDLAEYLDPVAVDIDVKPGNSRNQIHPGKKGRFWVAVLSDKTFDALQLDPGTVELGPGGALPDTYRVKDADKDGIPDLLVRYRVPDVGISCGDIELELIGETHAGQRVAGMDRVQTVGCGRSRR